MSDIPFTSHILHMPFKRLIEFIYWDNHGGDCMDIEPDDWTMAMALDALQDGYDWQEFSEAYARFLEAAK